MFRWITGLIASPSGARKNFIRFVMGTPQMKEYLIQEVARQNLKNHYEALGRPSDNIPQQAIDAYIFRNQEKVVADIKVLAEDFAHQVIPGFDWFAVIKHIGLFSLLLGPSIFFLIKEICDRLGETPPGRSLYEPVVAVTLLISLVIAIGVALILDARKK